MFHTLLIISDFSTFFMTYVNLHANFRLMAYKESLERGRGRGRKTELSGPGVFKKLFMEIHFY